MKYVLEGLAAFAVVGMAGSLMRRKPLPVEGAGPELMNAEARRRAGAARARDSASGPKQLG